MGSKVVIVKAKGKSGRTLSILGVRISAVTRQLSYEVMPGPDIFQMCSMPGECPSQYVRVAGKFTL